MIPEGHLRLAKHQALGNDFLVLLDPPAGVDLPALARAACDRHYGIGSDGLVVGTTGASADLTMTFHNPDGSKAEMSGNGVRCLVQAAVLAGLAPEGPVTVATDAGLRRVEIQAAGDTAHEVSVDMGPVTIGGDADDWRREGVAHAGWASVGNPHIVLFSPDPDRAPSVEDLGREANEVVEGGVNVEVVTPRDEPDHLDMRVYERGAGVTLACGTGACASAALAHHWGVAPAAVTIHMPGGAAQVAIGDTVILSSPTIAVGRIDFRWPLPEEGMPWR